MYVLTYTDNLDAVRAKGVELIKQGKHLGLLELYGQSFKVNRPKPPVAYREGTQYSLALMHLMGYDVEPFCSDLGLTVLASGTNCYQQVQDNPEMLALYENVLPPIDVLDENGEPTGEKRFNQWYEIDAPIRS